ncbi:MAG: glutamate synthase-related protein [Anaerolineae bacterium]|nr:glutamate synthase-related protein [Anaerolineae bacterium]
MGNQHNDGQATECRTSRAPLYEARFEHDACGIGFVADLSGRATHRTLDDGLRCLERLAHRGALDADGKSGDGAGVLCSIPHVMLNRELERLGMRPHREGEIAVGMMFLPRDPMANRRARALVEAEFARRELPVLTWRTVVHEPNALGQRALQMLPDIQQVLIARPAHFRTELAFDQHLYLVRRCIENAARAEKLEGFYVCSLSCRTVVYKALVSATQLRRFYLDLNDPDFKVSHVLFHQRYSTNTLPTWERAQPFRFLCHNGEINTIEGNQNWMRAREPELDSLIWGSEIENLKPIVDLNSSDTGRLDNVIELLTLGGRDIRHAIKMCIPQAWEKDPDLSPAVKGFFRYHASLMEPWDGPASIVFSDGELIGLALDRNGLRPARYLETRDGIVYAGSEIGALDVEPEKIVVSGKLGPGEMICADLRARRLFTNDEILRELSSRKPYREWSTRQRVRLEEVAQIVIEQPAVNSEALLVKQAQFGWTTEELTLIVKTMFEDGTEPVGSMGDDTPHAVLSPKARPLFNYFKQRFAEVTNPPIDHLREEQVMSLRVLLGRRGNLLAETEELAHLVRLKSPVLSNEELKALQRLDDPDFQSVVLDATFPIPAKGSSTSANGSSGEEPCALEQAVRKLCADAERAVRVGASILIISDRRAGPQRALIPSLLAVGAVHHHLMRRGLRSRASLVVESGEVRETHHFAVLLGYGASAINPYLALDTAREAVQQGRVRDKTLSEVDVVQRYIKAAEKGILKIMSKMGIATVDAYTGAQIFEAIGLSKRLIDECFEGTPSRIGGIGYPEVERIVLSWHANAYPRLRAAQAGEVSQPEGEGAVYVADNVKLDHPGFYKERAGGEVHGYSQRAVHALQKAVRVEGVIEYTGETELRVGIAHTKVKTFTINGAFQKGYQLYREFADLYRDSAQPIEPRDLLEIRSDRAPIPIEEVEPLSRILARFSSAAMSLGALSPEAHETLAIAMTRLGALSNSGEGGEETRRFFEEGNSGIKQVASGRFGVTPAYLMSAAELQIKMAQGSKPGEGGQIPGHKVTDLIARVRHTVPGVALISPPPHHDIYSIEDLAQLIYDLKQINPDAKVSVKLVAQAGVGTIAAGVVKALADVVLISGHSGGTGASPLSSIKNAGVPWELGLAETQQTLIENNLRGRARIRVDGGLRTGRDVIIAALLGADEYSFGTAALIAEGCIMARVCHLNTCPTGVATQKPELRAKFAGKPEHVMAYLLYVAQDVREHLAQMGYRCLDEIIGRTDLLTKRQPPKSESPEVLHREQALTVHTLLAPPPKDRPLRHCEPAPKYPPNTLNETIVRDAYTAIEHQWPVKLHYTIRNQDRSIGARLSGEITRRYADRGLPAGTIEISFRGYAGQSFGAFTTNGMRLHLVGAANDYVGKGMRGGEISIRPFPETTYNWAENHILGNTALYGATGGSLFAAGRAGERFAVRNSGACGIVEGVGDHACEYMTGGVVIVLGSTGRNFAAGMTGGMAFVYDPDGTFVNRCNLELVDVDRLTHPGMQRLVKSLLRRHYELTNSPRARELLVRWDEAVLSFRRILPKDRVAEIEAINEFSDYQQT